VQAKLSFASKSVVTVQIRRATKAYDTDCYTVIITENFNTLDTSFLEHDFGLTKRVQDIAHGESILDKFLQPST